MGEWEWRREDRKKGTGNERKHKTLEILQNEAGEANYI